MKVTTADILNALAAEWEEPTPKQKQSKGARPIPHRKRWRWSTGVWGARVSVFEHYPGSMLFIGVCTKVAGGRGWTERSLRHRDREKAKKQAKQLAAKRLAYLNRLGGPTRNMKGRRMGEPTDLVGA